MSTINTIRDKRREGYSKAGIARELGIDEKTVRKYLEMEDFSPKLPEKEERPSKLDPYKEQIRRWLAEDKKNWYKQRHTAKRIHERLAEENAAYDCSYLLVQRYVKKIRERSASSRACQELIWHPGETQADFGEADCYCRGEKQRKHYLTLTFPHSNQGYSQMFHGETAECVCQGLQDMFEEMGGVPPLIIFDNATGVGRRIGPVIREAQLFQQFRAHYGFLVRFCNPDSGHEKGNVENMVGYIRRNWFVPVPDIDDIEGYNRELLKKSQEKAEEMHYKKGKPIGELFAEDRAALLPLPTRPFAVCRYVYKKANGYGKVQVEGNHHYSTRPEYGGREVLVGIRAHTIDIYTEEKDILVRHRREFGKERTDSTDYRTSLAVLMRNVGAWPNSGIRELVPDGVRKYLDNQEREPLKDAIRTLHELSTRYSLELAMEAMEMAVVQPGETPLSDAAVFAARMVDVGLEGPPSPGPDLQVYDRFLFEEAGV
jgi:transposase